MPGQLLMSVNNPFRKRSSIRPLSHGKANPFNPTTNFVFALPKAGYVDLRVYDVLGREAASIVSEYKPAGKYTVEFDASGLSSGVYFYTIKSGDFIDTKKMVLIK